MDKTELTALVGSIQKFSTEDGPGIRTTVFLKGCPLACRWCHNPELIDFRQEIIELPNSCIHCGYCLTACPAEALFLEQNDTAEGSALPRVRVDREKCTRCLECARFCYAGALKAVAREMTVSQVLYEVEQDKGFYDETGGGMTISGGEILSRPDFVRELIQGAGALGITVCLDTSGYGNGDVLCEFAGMENVSHILYDMKSLDDCLHQEYTGVSNRIIRENLERLAADPVTREKIWMRMPLIHGVNDGRDMIRDTSDYYQRLGIQRVSLLPYHSLGISKMYNIGGSAQKFKAPPEEHMQWIRHCFQAAGIEVVDQ